MTRCVYGSAFPQIVLLRSDRERLSIRLVLVHSCPDNIGDGLEAELIFSLDVAA